MNYKTIKLENKTLEIIYDNSAENPREWDNLGTFLYAHGRYNLGEETFDTDLYNGWNEALNGEVGSMKEIIALPVYMYNHGQIALSTESFHGRALHAEWDSGRVGWIYVTREDVRKNYGVKRISAKLKDRVEKVLRAEIELQSSYINGEVYGYRLIDNEKDEEIDSCFGFYGDDFINNGMADELPEEFHSQLN